MKKIKYRVIAIDDKTRLELQIFRDKMQLRSYDNAIHELIVFWNAWS